MTILVTYLNPSIKKVPGGCLAIQEEAKKPKNGDRHLRSQPPELFLFAAGVGFVVDRHQLINTDLGIFLRRGKRGMAKQLLNGTQIGPTIKKMSGEGMSQGVGTNVLDDSCFDQAGF